MPDNQVSFKTRVKNTLIQYAGVYYTQFVCKDYLLISDAFHKRAYYILSAEKDNSLHLTGVTTSLSPSSFFDKCLNGTLEEEDFELAVHPCFADCTIKEHTRGNLPEGKASSSAEINGLGITKKYSS